MSASFSHQDDVELRGAADHAASHRTTNDTPDFFSGILNQLGPMKDQVASEGIDEEGMSLCVDFVPFPFPYPTLPLPSL